MYPENNNDWQFGQIFCFCFWFSLEHRLSYCFGSLKHAHNDKLTEMTSDMCGLYIDFKSKNNNLLQFFSFFSVIRFSFYYYYNTNCYCLNSFDFFWILCLISTISSLELWFVCRLYYFFSVLFLFYLYAINFVWFIFGFIFGYRWSLFFMIIIIWGLVWDVFDLIFFMLWKTILRNFVLYSFFLVLFKECFQFFRFNIAIYRNIYKMIRIRIINIIIIINSEPEIKLTKYFIGQIFFEFFPQRFFLCYFWFMNFDTFLHTLV